MKINYAANYSRLISESLQRILSSAILTFSTVANYLIALFTAKLFPLSARPPSGPLKLLSMYRAPLSFFNPLNPISNFQQLSQMPLFFAFKEF